MLAALIGQGVDDKGNTIFGAPHFFVAVRCTIRGDNRILLRARTGRREFLRRRARVMDMGPDQFLFAKLSQQGTAVLDAGADLTLMINGFIGAQTPPT